MSKKIKIIIAGIGGVGGYFGGLLAKQYEDSDEVEICFIARGEHLQQMRANGLRVIAGDQEFVAHPALATDNPAEIGMADYIIVCTKSYDLEATLEQLKPCIAQHTILLPLLNGVDATERIKQALPGSIVLHGCVYIVSALAEPGVIKKKAGIESFYFGAEVITEPMTQLLGILKEAGIDATLSDKIASLIWEKFIFISPTATATSYFNNSIGELLADADKQATVVKLIDEVKQVAIAKGIMTDPGICKKSLGKLKAMPYEATSSMHNDYKAGKQRTELESLTGYVVHAGKELKVSTPTFDQLYSELLKR